VCALGIYLNFRTPITTTDDDDDACVQVYYGHTPEVRPSNTQARGAWRFGLEVTGEESVYYIRTRMYMYMYIIMYVRYGVTGGVRFIMSRYTLPPQTAITVVHGSGGGGVMCVRRGSSGGDIRARASFVLFFENFPVFHKHTNIYIYILFIRARKTVGRG